MRKFDMLSLMRKEIIIGLSLVLCLGGLASCTKKKKKNVNSELRMFYVSEVPHMDPAQMVSAGVARKVELLYDTLYEFHFLKRPFQVAPNLAAKLPKIIRHKNGKVTYIITLKKGILFHKNPCFGKKGTRELTAQDVVYSYKRLIDAKVGSRMISLLKELWEGADTFLLESKKKTPTNYALNVPALEVKNKYTVHITLKRPHSVFLYLLMQQDFSILPREAVEKYGERFGSHPVGTGPYQLKKWVRKSKMIFEANPTYHGRYPTKGTSKDQQAGLLKDAGKSLPLIKTVIMQHLQEPEPRWLKFLKAEVDFADIPRERYGDVIQGNDISADMKKKGILGTKFQGLASWNLYFNLRNPYFSNIHVRRAFALALDIPSVLNKLFKDKYQPSHSNVPPLSWPKGQGSFKHPFRGPNVKQALDELKKAGYPGGKGLPEFKVYASAGASYRQWVESMAYYLKKVGITVTYAPVNSIQWLKVMTKGQFELLMSGGVGSYPDAEDFLSSYSSKNYPDGGNYYKFLNSDFDQWYKDILRLPLGSEKRRVTVAKMIRLLQTELPVIPLMVYNTFTLRYSYIKNYKSNDGLWSIIKYLKKEL